MVACLSSAPGHQRQVGKSCGSASTRARSPGRGGAAFSAAVWAAFLFTSLPNTSCPSSSQPTSQAEDSGALHSSPCCHAPSLTGVLSRCVLECVSYEYLDHLTPCMARTHVIFCLCHLSAGELWPLGLAVFPTVPWPGLWLLLYLFQKPGPWACSSSRRLPRAQPSTAGSCLTGAALGYLSPAHLPCCPLYHTRHPRLLCCGLAPRW